MKKIFLIIALSTLSFSLNSCSNSSYDSGSNQIFFKVNGTSKTFSNVTVTANGEEITVYAFIGSAAEPTETVFFMVSTNGTGSNALFHFEYTNSTDTYYMNTSPFTRNVTANNDIALKGTFSGSLNSSSTATLAITEGSFDIER